MTGIKPSIFSNSIINELKCDMLLFDKIAILNIDRFLNIGQYLKDTEPNIDDPNPVINELKYLRESNLVLNVELGPSPVLLKPGADLRMFQQILDEGNYLRQTNSRDFPLIFETLARIAALNCTYRRENSFEAIPIIERLVLSDQNKIDKSDIIRLVINKMPIPDDKTPWENIIEFKQNSDNKGKFAGLRTWINKMSASQNSLTEIQDELEYLLYQYEKSLKLHNIKFRRGILQSIIVGTAEVAENVAKLNFSGIAKKLFSIHEEKTALLQLELDAPGKELAYIAKAKEVFNP
jgi:hypothetical protein